MTRKYATAFALVLSAAVLMASAFMVVALARWGIQIVTATDTGCPGGATTQERVGRLTAVLPPDVSVVGLPPTDHCDSTAPTAQVDVRFAGGFSLFCERLTRAAASEGWEPDLPRRGERQLACASLRSPSQDDVLIVRDRQGGVASLLLVAAHR